MRSMPELIFHTFLLRLPWKSDMYMVAMVVCSIVTYGCHGDLTNSCYGDLTYGHYSDLIHGFNVCLTQDSHGGESVVTI